MLEYVDLQAHWTERLLLVYSTAKTTYALDWVRTFPALLVKTCVYKHCWMPEWHIYVKQMRHANAVQIGTWRQHYWVAMFHTLPAP